MDSKKLREKNAIHKVAALLQGVYLLLQSAMTALQIYAPDQTNLITVLRYIQEVIRAVLQLQPLPTIPPFLLPLEENDERAFGLQFTERESGDNLETVVDLEDSDERAVTATLADITPELPAPEILEEQPQPEPPQDEATNNPDREAATSARQEEMFSRESPINN